MLKIELITNYFPPEMGAAADRMYNLAKGLQQLDHEVEVIAPMPNYPENKIYEGYRNRFKVEERINEILVRRYWILPSFMPNTILRFFGMLSFPVALWASLFHLWNRKPDIVIIQNTPLLVAFSALILTKLLPSCKKVLNVSDLWPLSAAELGLIKKEERKYKIMEWLESYNYSSSDLIVGQSNEIIQYIHKRADRPFFLYRNISPGKSSKESHVDKYHQGRPKIVYAGLLSTFQGVYEICSKVNFHELEAEFHIYGSGQEEQDIRQYIRNHPDSNIHFHGRVTKEELQRILPEYHASIVPLKNRIYGAVPSKIFESILLRVPVLFCGSGEGAEIVEENELGYTAEPGDYSALENNILRLKKLSGDEYKSLLQNCRRFAKKELDFDQQLQSLLTELKNLVA